MPDLVVLLVAEPTLVAAYAVFGMVGFGTTLVSAPLLAHVLPLSTVIPALALTDFVASGTTGLRLGAHVVTRELLALLPAMVIGSALGAWLLFAVPVRALMLLLGIFVVLYALNGLRPKPTRVTTSPNPCRTSTLVISRSRPRSRTAETTEITRPAYLERTVILKDAPPGTAPRREAQQLAQLRSFS